MIDELKTLLITELNLEDVTTDEIDPAAPLFQEGLGLDSIDALELAVILDKKLDLKYQTLPIGLSILGFLYALWAIYGSGSDTVFYGFLLLLLSIPFYLLMKWNNRNQ